MFSRCLFCHAPYPANESLEHLRTGKRVAFDPGRGRLWAVCDACGRWNLAPIEERWEALEELDRIATDRARPLAQTPNVALLRWGEMELVRVGGAALAEEAWWRYGRDLLRRRKRSQLLQGVEVVAMIGIAVATGGTMAGFWGHGILGELARWRRFGRVAWRGEAACERCDGAQTQLRFRDAGKLVLAPGQDGGVALRLPCPRCGVAGEAGFRLQGTAAEHTLRRLLAHRHFHGASEERVRDATRAIEDAGSAAALARGLAERRTRLDTLGGKQRTWAVALEIAVNDQAERELLQMELAALEARWREEEEIAAIVDRELSWIPGLDRLVRAVRNAPGECDVHRSPPDAPMAR